jgi:hypothetical protein
MMQVKDKVARESGKHLRREHENWIERLWQPVAGPLHRTALHMG